MANDLKALTDEQLIGRVLESYSALSSDCFSSNDVLVAHSYCAELESRGYDIIERPKPALEIKRKVTED